MKNVKMMTRRPIGRLWRVNRLVKLAVSTGIVVAFVLSLRLYFANLCAMAADTDSSDNGTTLRSAETVLNNDLTEVSW
jgi:hypothetical protein